MLFLADIAPVLKAFPMNSPIEPENTPLPPHQHPEPPMTSDAQIPVVNSEELLQGQRQVVIKHGESLYRLLLTKSGKLILQK
ncbi:MAG: hemin uptake protein HemP [Pirellulales bacterium]|nr:hemin uptake protein HemP [Pirellulales bacterium]